MDTELGNPNLKWAETLWRYRRKHSGTPATTVAATEALRLAGESKHFESKSY